MNKSILHVISRAILRHDSSIKFYEYKSAVDINDLLEELVAYEPKVTYYIDKLSLKKNAPGSYTLGITYQNQDVPESELFNAKSQDECLDLMCRAASDFKQKLVLIYSGDKQLASEPGKLFLEKHGSFFPNLISYSSTTYGFERCGKVFDYSFEYRIGKVKLEMMRIEVEEEIERLRKLLFTPSMPPEAKVYLAHNYLTATVKYVLDHEDDLETSYTQSAYGALIKHQCVCQGYAEAFKRLLNAEGIVCDMVRGKVLGSEGYHAWNTVTLDEGGGNRFHVDVTWDAAGGKPDYSYFCKNDSFFSGKRIWSSELHHPCPARYSVLSTARSYIFKNRASLLARGIPKEVLDC